MPAVMCSIYMAFPCALAPWAVIIGCSKEGRAIKADVSAQKGWKMISHLGDTCGLCPSCSKYLLFISTAALPLAGVAHAVGVRKNPRCTPSCLGHTPPCPVWLQSSALLPSLQPRDSITDPPVPPVLALPLLEIVSSCPSSKALGQSHALAMAMSWSGSPRQPWEAEMGPKSLQPWVTSPSQSLLSSLSLSLWFPSTCH